MKYYVDNIYAPLQANERDIRAILANQLGVSEGMFRFHVVKRRMVLVNNKPCLRYDAVVDTFEFVRNTSLHFFEGHSELRLPRYEEKTQPVIVGAGFTGLFAAYLLAKSGAKPIVLEQGEETEARKNTCAFLESRGAIATASNFRNGEGGSAAMFGGYVEQLPNIAENDFLLRAFKDIGLNNYPEIEDFRFTSAEEALHAVRFMEKTIRSAGGEILFSSRIQSVERFLSYPKAVTYTQNGTRKTIKTKAVILASGTSEYSLYAAMMCRFPLRDVPPRLACFVETNGRDFESEYYGRGRTGAFPPLFLQEKIPNRWNRDIRLDFAYPNATLVNGAIEPNTLDLRLVQNPWSGNGNAIACLSVSLKKEEAERMSKEGSPAFASRFLGECCKKETPHAAPAETLDDFLSKKEPLLLGPIRSSCRGGVYLMNLHRLLPRDLDEAFTHGLYQAARKFPLLLRGGSVLVGFSTIGSAKVLPDPAFVGNKGVYQALPGPEDGRNLLRSGERALHAVQALLSGR